MKAFTCPHCGASGQYDPTGDKIKCEYCDTEMTVQDYINVTVRDDSFTTNELTCTQCGAVIYSTDNTVATFCSYCGSSVLLESRIVKERRPKYIIPFKIEKEEAEELYRNKIKRIVLAPDWMEEEATAEKFRGIYMPFHLYKYTYDGTYEGQGESFKVEVENGKKYDVTKTYNVGAPVYADYHYIPADASSSFPDGLGRGVCPYYEKDMVEFKEPYLAGFYADKSDVDPGLYDAKYESLVLKDMSSASEVNTGAIKVPTNEVMKDVKLKGEVKSALFPVWFMSYRNKKKDRISYAAVNGATGEVVADIPIDFKKYLVASIIVAGLFSIFLNLGFSLTPQKLVLVSSFLSFAMFFISNRLVNDTYRRKKHFDDVGYTGVDKDKVRKNKIKAKKKSGNPIFWFFGFMILMFVSAFAMEVIEAGIWLFMGMMVTIPVITAIFIISTFVKAFKNTQGVIQRKKAPIFIKMWTTGKPFLGMIINMIVGLWDPVNDMYYYVAGIISIVLIILCAFDVVREQNKYTMRDLPLFTEKRGGE